MSRVCSEGGTSGLLMPVFVNVEFVKCVENINLFNRDRSVFVHVQTKRIRVLFFSEVLGCEWEVVCLQLDD